MAVDRRGALRPVCPTSAPKDLRGRVGQALSPVNRFLYKLLAVTSFRRSRRACDCPLAAEIAGPLLQKIRWIEIRDTRLAAGNPTQNIHLPRVRQRMRNGVERHFEEGVRQQVFVVVDVGLHYHAIHTVDSLRLAFVKRELHVGLSKLNLLPTASGARMKQRRPNFGRELCRPGLDDLVDQFGVGPGEKAVLLGSLLLRIVPDDLVNIIEGRTLRQVDLRHGSGQVEETGQHGRLFFHQLRVAVLGGGVIGGAGGQQAGIFLMVLLQQIPACVPGS